MSEGAQVSSGIPQDYYSVQFNAQYWVEAGRTAPLEESFNPFDDAQLAHGQVYFRWDGSNSRFEVIQFNGPGGLIVDDRMAQLPSQQNNRQIWMVSGATTSSALNYFYIRRPDTADVPTVTDAQNNGSGLIQLTLSTTNGASSGDQMWLKCYNILGTIEANGIGTGTVVDSTHVDLIGSSFSTAFDQSSTNPRCNTAQLTASTTGHITSNRGVEILNNDIHYTLVGLCYIGASHSVNDNSTHRDCASWYNRKLKTCINKFTTDHTTTSTSYTEIDSEIRCEFVTWGDGDPRGENALSWSISGMMKNGTSGDGAAVSAGFDPTPLVETEESAVVNPTLSVGGGVPASVNGSKAGLSEGKHYITLLGKAITGGTATFFGSTPHTSLEIRIPQ